MSERKRLPLRDDKAFRFSHIEVSEEVDQFDSVCSSGGHCPIRQARHFFFEVVFLRR
jgi:hypothetical protein